MGELAASFRPVYWDGQRLEVVVTEKGDEHRVWFEANHPFRLEGDTLAVALSTLCGTKYERIQFDFEVSSSTLSGISRWTQSEARSEGGETALTQKPIGHGTVLSFSGGLDSLSSKFLLGDAVDLVSMDFGGRFSRERVFFDDFDPWTISTNLIATPLRFNSWSFMGIGALLLADELGSRYHAFGSILEAGQLSRTEPMVRNATFPPFQLAGYESVAPVAGISEAGTVLIVLNKAPELMEGSLKSLASPGEEKFHRKIALAKSVSEIFGYKIDLPDLPSNPKVHFRFGQNFTVDLTALFFHAMGQSDYIEAIVGDFPEGLGRKFNSSDLEFMLKADQNYYSVYPQELTSYLNEGLMASGIEWYSESDYGAVERLRRELGAFHPRLWKAN